MDTQHHHPNGTRDNHWGADNCPICSHHDFERHHIDRIMLGDDRNPEADNTRWPTCPRCAQLCIEFHDRRGIAHWLPDGYRERFTGWNRGL